MNGRWRYHRPPHPQPRGALKLVTPPATEAIDLDYVKTKLRVDHDDDDLQLTALIAGAIAYADGPGAVLGRALTDQTWDFYLDDFPPTDHIRLPLPPLIEVLGVFYQDGDGVEQQMDEALYAVAAAGEPGRVVLLSGGAWPTARVAPEAVRVRFRAGYLDQTVSPAADAVPEDIRLALAVLVQADYDTGPDPAFGDKMRAAADAILSRKRFDLSLA